MKKAFEQSVNDIIFNKLFPSIGTEPNWCTYRKKKNYFEFYFEKKTSMGERMLVLTD